MINTTVHAPEQNSRLYEFVVEAFNAVLLVATGILTLVSVASV